MYIPTALQNSACSVFTQAVDEGTDEDSGRILIYTAPRPADANTAVTTQTLLASIPLANPAFDSPVNGVAAVNGTPIESVWLASGTAVWARVVDRDGNTCFDGSVGTAGADFIISSTTAVEEATVKLTGGSLTFPDGT